MASRRTLQESIAWVGTARRTAWDAARRRPPVVTGALIACIVTTFIRLEVGAQLPTLLFITDAFSPRALIEGRFHTLATSAVLTRDVFMVISICISLLATMGVFEVIAGHLRATVLAVFAVVAGPGSVTLGLLVLKALGSTWAQGRLETLDIGASAIVAASSGAIAAIVGDRRLTIGLILFLVSGLAMHHQLADWEHLFVFPWGYFAGRVFGAAPLRARVSVPAKSAYAFAAAGLVVCALVSTDHILPPPRTYRSVSGRPLSPPRIVVRSYPTPSLGGSRQVLLLLPAGYDSNPAARYPVVELLHGDPGTPASLVTLGDLAGAQSADGIRPFIGIAPDGNTTGPFSWWANLPGRQLGTAVTDDLRNWATQQWRTDGTWSYAGLSSGGFAAAYLPLISSQPVHAVCALSGVFDGTAPPVKMLGRNAIEAASALAGSSHEPSLVFVAYGLSDRKVAKGSLAFARSLRHAHKDVVVKTYPGGHKWTVWRPAFVDCFRTILPSTAR